MLHLPCSLPELLWRLINNLILDELEELLLLLLIGGIFKVLQMDVAGVADMLAEDLDKPQLRVVSHMTKVELWKVLLLFLDMTADIAGEAEDLREDGVYFHMNVASPKDFLAGFERPSVRTNKNNVDVLRLQLLTSSDALRLTLLGDTAVNILFGIRNLLVKVWNFDAVRPAQIWVNNLLEAQEAFVKVGLCMSNSYEVTVFLLSLYLFNHIF